MSLQTLDSNGVNAVGTLTREQWLEAREAADLVHVVQSERAWD